MKFLLDTNAVSALLRNHIGIWSRLRLKQPTDIAMSTIVAHELFYGAHRGRRAEQTLTQIDELPFAILPFDAADARRAGEIRAGLSLAGTPIGPYDVLIAGQASRRGLVLVTRNLREFRRVSDLTVEDWETEDIVHCPGLTAAPAPAQSWA